MDETTVMTAPNPNDEPSSAPVDMENILAQHNMRWTIPTKAGGVRLKYLTKNAAQRRAVQLGLINNEYMPKLQRLDILKSILNLEGALNEERQQEFRELLAYMAPFADEYAILCFEHPKFESVEQFDIFMGMITPEEKEAIQLLCVTLKSALDLEQVDTSVLEICKAYGIAVSKDLTAETMTLQQFQVLKKGLLPKPDPM